MKGVKDLDMAEKAIETLRKEDFTGLWRVKEEDGNFILVIRNPNFLDKIKDNKHVKQGFTRYAITMDENNEFFIEISDAEVIQALAQNDMNLLHTLHAPREATIEMPADFYNEQEVDAAKTIKMPLDPNVQPLDLGNVQVAQQDTSYISKQLASQKKVSDFDLIRKLKSTEASGLYSHEVSIDKKTKRNAKPYEWFKKHEAKPEVAAKEVLAQELFRLFIPNHPKTRLVINEQSGDTYVASKKVPGFVPIEPMTLQDLHDKFLNRTYRGLGEVVVMALLLDESDLKLGNMGVDANGKLVKLDGDWCFCGLRSQLNSSNIMNSSVTALPCNTESGAYNWLDVKRGGKLCSPVFATDELQANPEFRQEVNETILKILVIPDSLLKQFVNHYIADSNHANQLFDFIIDRKSKLYEAVLYDQNFCQYVLSQSAATDALVAGFLNYIEQTPMTGKQSLIVKEADRNDALSCMQLIYDEVEGRLKGRANNPSGITSSSQGDIPPASNVANKSDISDDGEWYMGTPKNQ